MRGRKKEKFIVLDVEGNSTCLPYNIGYIVADNAGNIYQKRSIALPYAVWQNLLNSLETGLCKEMHLKNTKDILTDYENTAKNRKYKCISIESFWILFTSDIQKYNIKKLYAYNVAFDNSALSRLLGARYEMLGLEIRDIMACVVHARLLNPKYLEFCDRHGYLTEKGNYRYSAEIVYRYLKGDKFDNFEEEHTGLADVLIEYEILLWALKSNKKQVWSCICAWKTFQKFVEETGYQRWLPF